MSGFELCQSNYENPADDIKFLMLSGDISSQDSPTQELKSFIDGGLGFTAFVYSILDEYLQLLIFFHNKSFNLQKIPMSPACKYGV